MPTEDDFYSSPEYDQLMQDNPVEEVTDDGPTDQDVIDYINTAKDSGADFSWMTNIWNAGGKAVDTVSAWAKANPGLASIITSGISGGQKAKADREKTEQQRNWDLQDTQSKRDYEASLWERQNQSVINTKPANLGILGAGMYDKQIDYLKNRKK